MLNLLEPETRLATALLLAIRTETRGGEWGYSRLDRAVLPWLTERADPSQLAEIESAPLSVGYFTDLTLALAATEVVADTAFCLLPSAEGVEHMGQRLRRQWLAACGAERKRGQPLIHQGEQTGSAKR